MKQAFHRSKTNSTENLRTLGLEAGNKNHTECLKSPSTDDLGKVDDTLMVHEYLSFRLSIQDAFLKTVHYDHGPRSLVYDAVFYQFYFH